MTLRRIIDAVRSALAKRAGLLRVLALVGSVALMAAATPNAAEACSITDLISCIWLLLIKIFQVLVALMGWVLVLEIDALIRVAQYHSFVTPGPMAPSAVEVGWIVTRDLANMFFIVVLLIIAFGTILGSSTYHYEKNLPRLLIMAVVINFSKTICGIFIDMGQVVMLTFVNGFKEAAAGNFVNAFQINKLLALGENGGETFGLVVAMMFAFILTAIAVSVVLVMLVVLIFRIVVLWVLIILSPIAFLASAIPKGGDHYAQWWKEFKAQIIKGPVIAFFLWLSLASVQQSGGGLASKGFVPSSAASKSETDTASQVGDDKIPSEAGATSDVIMNMVIAICLMFAGLKFGNEVGGIGTGTANSIRNSVSKAARGFATYGAKRAAAPAMNLVGRGLAKVPLVGGLGRAAVLQSEKWKKERQAGREKFAGTPEDMARLSPSAYSRSLGKSKEPEQLARLLKAGESNPAAMKTAIASGATKSAMENLALRGRPGEVAAGIKAFNSNKLLADQARKDPELLKTLTDASEKAAKDDPNQSSAHRAHQQKYLPELLQKNLITQEKAKELIATMGAGEEILGISGKNVSSFMGDMTAAQLRKLVLEGETDQQSGLRAGYAGMDSKAQKAIRAKLGKDAPEEWLDGKTGSPESILASLPDAVGAGTLKVKDILADNIQAAIKANPDGVDLQALARSSAGMNEEQKAVARAVTSSVVAADPSKASAMKGEMFQDIRPDAGITAQLKATAEEKKAAAEEVAPRRPSRAARDREQKEQADKAFEGSARGVGDAFDYLQKQVQILGSTYNSGMSDMERRNEGGQLDKNIQLRAADVQETQTEPLRSYAKNRMPVASDAEIDALVKERASALEDLRKAEIKAMKRSLETMKETKSKLT